ncbi:imidazolonepropionase [Actinoplanes sp. TFC3]|uniref:imidazolonepropionase n=1 Tax=Actinoplanes sp. TFC3 TaxID=1710355 RepID=UPI0008319647
MSELITNIGQLVTADPAAGEGPLGILHDAALVLDNGKVAWLGPRQSAPAADTSVDAGGATVVPGFVDSHSHLVFGGDRADEFDARMSGQPYTAGGIRRTVEATRSASTEELTAHTAKLLDEALRSGTTTMEIKSGYGLSVPDERRVLDIASRFTSETTFLGAHVVPAEAESAAAYVELVAGEMLDAVAPVARWIDVFCDQGAFDVEQARTILTAGAKRGLGLRLHANQLGPSGAAQLGVELGAASIDHCTFLSGDDVAALAGSDTVATFVPGAEFSTRQPFPDISRLRDAGVSWAIATDCNPGSSYTSSLPFCIALAVRDMHMTPAEALLAATRGGARALRRDDIGRLSSGARADAILLDAPSFVHLAYRPGVHLVRTVWQHGRRTTSWQLPEAQ